MAALRSEMARSDRKVSLLLALTGAGLLALVSLGAGGSQPATAVAVGAASAAAMLAATVLLLLAVRPTIGGSGWPSWPDLPEEELHARVVADQHLAQVRTAAHSRPPFRASPQGRGASGRLTACGRG